MKQAGRGLTFHEITRGLAKKVGIGARRQKTTYLHINGILYVLVELISNGLAAAVVSNKPYLCTGCAPSLEDVEWNGISLAERLGRFADVGAYLEPGIYGG